MLPLVLAAGTMHASQQERVVETVLPSLAYGPACWSGVTLQNLGNRPVTVEVEGHRESGALVALAEQAENSVRLAPGERASFKLEIEEETSSAWIKVRERVPAPQLPPVIAIGGTTECVEGNELRTAARAVAYPTRNPWFSGDVAEIRGDVISLINTSERAAKASACYSSGGLYAVPAEARRAPELTPICNTAFEVQIPPFGARLFPVAREGNTHFSLKTKGEAIVLQMLRPAGTSVKVFTVDSSIKFGDEAPKDGK